MRRLLIIAATLSFAGCALVPEQQRERGEPASRTTETQRAAASHLEVGWQQLFDNRYERAMASFEKAVDSTKQDNPLHARARLGQALVLVDPYWSGRDPVRAAALVEDITGPDRHEESVAVFDWVLAQTVSRLIASENRQQTLERELGEAQSRNRSLNDELEQARSERVQAEETVSRLRQLIMGED